VLKTRVDLVMDALHYENFLQQYEETAIMINKEKQ